MIVNKTTIIHRPTDVDVCHYFANSIFNFNFDFMYLMKIVVTYSTKF